jgi:hypothetical protein
MPNYPQSPLFTAGWPQAWLREISGLEEQSVAGTQVTEAIGLVDRLLVKGHRSAGGAKDMASADRDRVLAAIYRQTYGDHIKGTLECRACEAPFDMDFSLGGFVDHTYAADETPVAQQLPDGSYLIQEGLQLRLPTGEDEVAVIGLDAEKAASKLLERCLVAGDLQAAEAVGEEMISQIAPMLQTEMAAPCPECGHVMSVSFDVQTYLLQSLLQDQERLAWEVHRLATAYGWGLKEILKLPRSMRRNYARLIESELLSSQ